MCMHLSKWNKSVCKLSDACMIDCMQIVSIIHQMMTLMMCPLGNVKIKINFRVSITQLGIYIMVLN